VLDTIIATDITPTGANCKDDGWRTMANSDGVRSKNQGASVSFYATSGATPIVK